MRFISLFASFGHNFKYSSSSHISIHPICNSGKPRPDPLHVFILALVTHRFETIGDTHDTRSVTHEAKYQTLGGPIARRFFVTWRINSFFLTLIFLPPFLRRSPNERLLPVRDTYGHHLPPGVYYLRRRCGERRDPSIRLHSFLLFRPYHRHLRSRFRFFPQARRFLLPVPKNEKISRVSLVPRYRSNASCAPRAFSFFFFFVFLRPKALLLTTRFCESLFW